MRTTALVAIGPGAATHVTRPAVQHSHLMKSNRDLLLLLLVAVSAALRSAGPTDWPQFRGVNGTGVADASKLPAGMVHEEERGVGGGDPRPRLVVAHRLARSGVSDVGGQYRELQAALHGHLRQRLRRRAHETGAARRRGQQARHRARHRAGGRGGVGQLRGDGDRGGHRQGAVAAGSASGQAAGRPASQEHLRVGNAGHRWRAPVCVVWRQRRVVLLFAGREAAVEEVVGAAADVSRLRHRVIAARAQRARVSAARLGRRIVPHGVRRKDR